VKSVTSISRARALSKTRRSRAFDANRFDEMGSPKNDGARTNARAIWASRV
jgi:hypothetical protein